MADDLAVAACVAGALEAVGLVRGWVGVCFVGWVGGVGVGVCVLSYL